MSLKYRSDMRYEVRVVCTAAPHYAPIDAGDGRRVHINVPILGPRRDLAGVAQW